METRFKIANVAKYGERALDPEFDPGSLQGSDSGSVRKIERNADTRRGVTPWKEYVATAKPRKKLLLERLVIRGGRA